MKIIEKDEGQSATQTGKGKKSSIVKQVIGGKHEASESVMLVKGTNVTSPQITFQIPSRPA